MLVLGRVCSMKFSEGVEAMVEEKTTQRKTQKGSLRTLERHPLSITKGLLDGRMPTQITKHTRCFKVIFWFPQCSFSRGK